MPKLRALSGEDVRDDNPKSRVPSPESPAPGPQPRVPRAE